MAKTFTLTLTGPEFFILKDAVEELCNDSDLIWGGADDHLAQYSLAGKLLERLEEMAQMEVTPH